MEHKEEGIIRRGNLYVELKTGYSYCHKCNKCNTDDNWYKNKYGETTGPCKDCISLEVGNDIIKAIPYLDLFDLPYLPEQWDHYKSFGKYLSFCKLASIKRLHFTDIPYWKLTREIDRKDIKNFQKALIKYINNKFNKCE